MLVAGFGLGKMTHEKQPFHVTIEEILKALSTTIQWFDRSNIFGPLLSLNWYFKHGSRLLSNKE